MYISKFTKSCPYFSYHESWFMTNRRSKNQHTRLCLGSDWWRQLTSRTKFFKDLDSLFSLIKSTHACLAKSWTRFETWQKTYHSQRKKLVLIRSYLVSFAKTHSKYWGIMSPFNFYMIIFVWIISNIFYVTKGRFKIYSSFLIWHVTF